MINCSNAYERIFKHFNEDGDRKLSPMELRCFLETIGDEQLPMEEARELVESMDPDGDGLLGSENLWGGWRERSEGMKREILRS